MSVRVMAQVWDLDLPAFEKLIESVAALPEPLANVGLARGWLKRDENGELVPAPLPKGGRPISREEW